PAHVPLVTETVDHVRAVAVKGHVALSVDRREALDRALELHALVRRGGLTAGQLPFAPLIDDDRGPSARARIAGAGTIGVDENRSGPGQGLVFREQGRMRRPMRSRRCRAPPPRLAAGARRALGQATQ